MSLPSFTASGLLPPGDHALALPELRASFLVTGDGVPDSDWDSAWRARLVDNLALFVGQLWTVGVDRIFVDGSFASDKRHPGDIDAYFECRVMHFPETIVRLLQLEPSLPWDWTHRPIDPATGIPKPMMWHRYRVELFPHFADQPNPTGVRDAYGNELLFPALFRRDRTTASPKGVIQLLRE